jgi:ABC-type lipoprotein export system ATPase subunit
MQNRLGSKELVDYPISVRYEILMLRDLSAELVLAPLQVFVQDEMSVGENARVEHARLLLAEEPLILTEQL